MNNNNLIAIFGVGTVLLCGLGGYLVVRNHQESELARVALIQKQNTEREMEKRRDFEAKEAQEFEQFYAGKLQSYNSIMGSRNLIPNLRIRSRSEIESDIYRLRSEIAEIKDRNTTVRSNTYNNSNGYSSRSVTTSTNISALSRELGSREYDLMIAEAELKRDDYFSGRISGQDL